MSKNFAKSLIMRMLKEADMPDFPGMSNMRTRTLQAGIRWKAFNLNEMSIQLSKLPEEVKKSIANELRRFETRFKQFPSAQHEDFRNVVRVAYCYDTNLSEDFMQYIADNPTLLETAKFARQNGLLLTPQRSGKSKGEMVSKSIDSPYWFSKFGYAYKRLYPEAIDERLTSVERKIYAYTKEVTEDNDVYGVLGTFQVLPSDNGYTFGIACNQGTTYIFDQHVDRFNPRTKTKFFREDKLLINSSAVVIPDLSQSEVFFIPSDLANKYVMQNTNIREAAGRKSTKLQAEDIAAYEDKFNQIPDVADKIYKIFVDENFSFYVQKQKKYSKFGRPKKDPLTGEPMKRDVAVGEKFYLNADQVRFLANPNALNKTFRIVPEEKNDDATDAEIASGSKFYYSINDEQVNNAIYNPNPNDIATYAKSIPALVQLKQKVDEYASLRSGGEISEAHTALEGFKIYMVAPDFAAAADVGAGKSKGTLKGTEHGDVVDLPQDIEQPGTLVHSKTFVVVAQQIPVERIVAAGRVTSRGRISMPEWRQVAGGFVTFKEAIEKMNQLIRGDGGTIEDYHGNIINTKDRSPISEKARSVPRADQVMDEFRTRPDDMRGGEQLPIKQITQDQFDAAIINDNDEEQTRRASALLNKIFRRLG